MFSSLSSFFFKVFAKLGFEVLCYNEFHILVEVEMFAVVNMRLVVLESALNQFSKAFPIECLALEHNICIV